MYTHTVVHKCAYVTVSVHTITAIRAGDYYLFEEGGDEQLDKTDGKVPDSLTFGRDDADHDKRLGPLQVMGSMWFAVVGGACVLEVDSVLSSQFGGHV